MLLFVCCDQLFAQWTIVPPHLVSLQPNLILTNSVGGQNRIYFGSGSIAGTNYMNFEKVLSNYGFSLKLNNLDRFTIYPSDIGGGTDIERDGNTNVKIGSSANNTNIFLYGIVFPRMLQFPDNTTLNSANFITSIVGLSSSVLGLTSNLFLLTSSVSGLNSNLALLTSSVIGVQNALLLTNTGLNNRILQTETNTNSAISTVNTQLLSVTTVQSFHAQSITGLSTQLSNLQTSQNVQNISVTNSVSGLASSVLGLTSTISLLNSSVTGISNSIVGLNTRLALVANTNSTNWEVKPSGLEYKLGNVTTTGNFTMGNELKLSTIPVMKYTHYFKIVHEGITHYDGSVNSDSPTPPVNCGPFTGGNITCLTTSTTTSALGKISMSAAGLSLEHTAGNAVTITPNGGIRFKNGTEITSAGNNTWQKIGTNIVNAGDNVIQIKGNNTLEFGVGIAKQVDAGKIVYGVWGSGLCIVGGGTTVENRKITFYTEGGADFVGSVNIGTVKPKTTNYRLAADGNIVAKGYLANPTLWPDYVFDKSFNLTPLIEVENYINENAHLKGIPSAEEVSQNGIDLVKLNTALLQKIEELTLYMIQMEKKVKQLEANIKP